MSSADFDAFFQEVHGRLPFPWQSRLAGRVVFEDRWPHLLDLPTGTGKTSAIDIALFALAQRPDIFPRRIVLVVDRRVVVDQGAEHARKIQKALTSASHGTAASVAASLRSLFGGHPNDAPFVVSVLRGGMPHDEAWADRPDRPVVALSTVDQVGSRLLFRGYGVSPRMSPIHAGLLGNDTLFLLDEVQLSTAFAETLRGLHRRWRRWHTRQSGVTLPDRWSVVEMSATPISEEVDEVPFRLEADDRAHADLRRRLAARKLVHLEKVRVSGEEADRSEQFAQACALAVRRHITSGAAVAAVVVNRVDTARRVYRVFHEGDKRAVDAVLLTGRMRPLDRVDILGDPAAGSSVASRIVAGRARAEQRRPLVVVATQCIEAGADFDFDALVTECASLDSLRQRFGRVDRRGELGETQSTIVVRHDQIDDTADDPIYGGALSATWRWLEEQSQSNPVEPIDFGTDGLPSMPKSPEERARLCSPIVRPPILLPAHIDAWAQTNPRPEPDPDVALWLHGPSRDVPEVRIVWRADVDDGTLNHQIQDASEERHPSPRRSVPLAETHRRKALARELLPQLVVCPPSSLEAIAVPLPAARAWLASQRADPFGDVEGAREVDGGDREQRHTGASRLCLRLRQDRVDVVGAEDLRPDDTLVVPSNYGGIAHGSWDPESRGFVADLGDWAQLVHRGRPVLRLVPEVLAGPAMPPRPGNPSDTRLSEPDWCSSSHAQDSPTDGPDLDPRDGADRWIDSVQDAAGPKLRAVLRALTWTRARYRVVRIAGGRLALVGRRRVDPRQIFALPEDATGEVVTEDDESGSFAGLALTLGKHLDAVRDQTREFAEHLGLGERLASDLALAAGLHDVGKADRRFQQMLAGGSEVRLALQTEPLAKSNGDSRDFASRDQARHRAGYPDGYRHELLSVAMIERTPGVLDKAHDSDLVLHLVGSHHGWCRPFAPAVDDGPPLDVRLDLEDLTLRADATHGLARLDSGVADRFWSLVERYGWWGLAWLEAIVRLADHRSSELAIEGRADEGPTV